MMTPYPKRLIEVDLPIKRISAHARREKSIRHGHISTLHIWWARRPQAACRAVILASLWPDPADPMCPPRFLEEARKALEGTLGGQTTVNVPKRDYADPKNVRAGLLDFIAEFANWDNSTNKDYLEFSRHLVQVAHESLGGAPGTRPLVVDPFAGGGSIPLEALRIGADAFASDLNPVAVLLNKVAMEYIPKYGKRLAEDIRKWGAWIKKQAEIELGDIYPVDADGAVSIAYFWARSITCEGPACGYQIPLIRSTTITKKEPFTHLKIVENQGNRFDIVLKSGNEQTSTATIRGGKATCPHCGYTTPATRVKLQLVGARGGADTARLYAVLEVVGGRRRFRSPSQQDLDAVELARSSLLSLLETEPARLPTIELNPLRPYKNTVGTSIVTRLGIRTVFDLYNSRQAYSIMVFQRVIEKLRSTLMASDSSYADALANVLDIALNRLVMQNSSLSRWHTGGAKIEGMFSKQALQVIWDYVEANPIGPSMANWDGAIQWVAKVVEENLVLKHAGTTVMSNADACPLPADSADLLFTDPPYFAAIPYADLSDVFYAWLHVGHGRSGSQLFNEGRFQRDHELIVTNSARGPSGEIKDSHFFTTGMSRALAKGREITRAEGISCIVFADSSTSSWEAMLSAIISSGWTVTASWPVDTELQNRTQARESASLQSSVFMVCRPREASDGSSRDSVVGDWRDVLNELPGRIHEWLPRLADEGVVGADAIFACLGPALEIFSRYSRVEKANGDPVTLRDYLEYVWAAVAREALSLVFNDADASGLEPDARLTAMWLWTLSTGLDVAKLSEPTHEEAEDDSGVEDDEEAAAKPSKPGGFALEFDAARKIAQGLGAHLEDLTSIVEAKGQVARLLPVSERAKHPGPARTYR